MKNPKIAEKEAKEKEVLVELMDCGLSISEAKEVLDRQYGINKHYKATAIVRTYTETVQEVARTKFAD